MTDADLQLIHRAVKMVAGNCDGARAVDGQGFNGGDAEFGRSLAHAHRLTPGQAQAALRMLPKYRRQLGNELAVKLSDIMGRQQTEAAAAKSKPLDAATVKTLLPWGPPRHLNTRVGARVVRAAAPSEEFWHLWRERKEELKSLGVSVGKNPTTLEFEAAIWATPDGKTPPRPSSDAGKAIVEAVVERELPEPLPVPPEIAAKLLEYQVPSVSRLAAAINTWGSALDASDTGAGKTYVGMAVAATLGRRVIIVCPKSVIGTWHKVGKHFGLGRENLRLGEERVIPLNYEALKTGKSGLGIWERYEDSRGKPAERFTWTVRPDDLVIFDEVHRAKNYKSQNAEMLIRAREQGLAVLMASATAARDPLEMKAVGYSLGLFPKPTAYFEWLFSHGCSKGRFGMEFNGGVSAPPDNPRRKEACGKVLKGIHADIFSTGKGCRLRTGEIPGFPETLIIPDSIDFNGAGKDIKEAYDAMMDALSRLDEVAKEDRQGVVLTEMLRARQKSELLKIPATAEMVEDAIDEGNSVAVFLNFNESLDELAARLKTRCFIRGGQSQAERDRAIEDFQADRQRVILCNIRAGGVGVSLHDLNGNFPRLSLIFPTWSCQDMLQALGRVWRSGGKTKSVQRILFALGTIEEDAAHALDAKKGDIATLNDGDLTAGIPVRFRDAIHDLLSA